MRPLPSRKFLITGFKPFLQDTLNPSEILALDLCQEHPEDLQALILPVSYERSYSELQRLWQEHGPFSGLLMLGQAAGRAHICLERIAVNWVEGSSPDEDRQLPPTGPLLAGQPEARINDFFPSQWQRRLSQFGPVQISFSAGTYVCNSLYYRVLNELCPGTVPSLFVHLPYLPEQTRDKPSVPSLEFETQKRILRELLQLWKLSPSIAST